MDDQKNVSQKGGTMRLGAYNCDVMPGTKLAAAYGATQIKERHRHRYEFNNAYLQAFEEAGMIASGKNPESGLVETIELKDHPFYIGAQFHPEYKSTVLNPHPLFVAFVKAAKEKKGEA
jgi:CTP synthase